MALGRDRRHELRPRSGMRGGEAMVQDFGAQGGLVGQDQTLDGDVVLEMRLHDLWHVGWFHAGIPDAFGVDDHVGSVGAQAERTTNRDLDFIFESMSGDFPAQRVDDLGRTMTGAARCVLGLFLIADKHVKTEGLHIWISARQSIRLARPNEGPLREITMERSMKILIANIGSTSFKYRLFDRDRKSTRP